MLTKSEAMKNLAKKRNEKITLWQPDDSEDEAGGYEPKWILQSTLWSEFRKISASTELIGGAVVSNMTIEISIRYRKDVQKGWQVRYGDRTFDIVHTYSYGKETTILVCREVII